MIAFVRSVTAARDQRRVDVEVALAHVDEDGRRAGVDDHVRGRGPRDRRRDHLVAGLDPERDEREVHRRRAGGDGEHVLRLEVLGHPLLEQRRPRAGRQPAGAERLGDRLDLLLADRRRLEAEWSSRASFDDEAYFVRGGASALERLLAAVADREHGAGPVGAAQQRAEDVARLPVDAARRARRRPRAPPRAPSTSRSSPRARRGRGRRRRPRDFVFLKHKPRFRARSRARARSA